MKNKFQIIFLLALFLGLRSHGQQCLTSGYGGVVVSEIYFDTHYCEDIEARFHSFGEYIELYNSSDTPIDLNGWRIDDNHTSYTFNTTDGQGNNLIIQPGGFKIITYNGFYAPGFGTQSVIGGRQKFLELFPLPNITNPEQDIILQNRMVLFNEVDKVTLVTPQGKIADEVSYLNGSTSREHALDYMDVGGYTIEIQPKIDNANGYFFNGEIGYIYIFMSWPAPGAWVEVQTNQFRNVIYRNDPNSFYTNSGVSFGVGLATPMALPAGLNVPLHPIDPYLYYVHNYSNEQNYKESMSFDIKTGDLDGQSRNYFDALGKPSVSLTQDFNNNIIWGTETIYDGMGRKYRESYPAISCFEFEKMNFLSNPIVKSVALDTYYANSNTIEPYQPTAQQPYSEANYDKLNPGKIISTVGGNQVAGEWKTGYSYTVPAAQEMYYAFGRDFFDGPVNSGYEEVVTRFYKAVKVDANGNESVSFTDGEGKVLASARAGASNSVNPYPVISVIGTQGYIDVHIPSGIQPSDITLLGGDALYDVYDLKTGSIAATPLTGGHAYRVAAKAIPTTDAKTYVGTSGSIVTTSYGAKGIAYKVNYYDYALNIYDKVGRLRKTIQPNGFKAAYPANPATVAISAVPSYMGSPNFATSYTYNTAGKVIQSVNPDKGTTRYAYRRDGLIRYSQNALQAASNQVSYTNYDDYGRPVESGVLSGNATIWTDAEANADNTASLSGTTRSERSFVIYDYADNNALASIQIPSNLTLAALAPSYTQHNVTGMVAVIYDESSTIPGTVDAISWFSYDIFNRKEWMAKYIRGIEGSGNVPVVKTIDYEFDHKGNIAKVTYQKNNTGERFTHQYTYTVNGLLSKVETASGNNPLSTEAEYTYYKTGELKRVNIAQGAQGMDYVYTLGGSLKSINHPSLEQLKDPGRDGVPGTPNANVVPDLFGMSIDYYAGDYNRAGTNIITSPSITPDYNGNIKATRSATKNSLMDWQTGSVTAQQKAYLYNYDKNNYLTSSAFGLTNASGVITPNPTYPDQYQEKALEYDPNGNITKLQRTNSTAVVVDNLTYNYPTTGTNQLASVTDAVTSTSYVNDINPQAAGNYVYNALGQMTLDKSETTHYTYNTQGLVTEVRKGNLSFASAFPVMRIYYNEQGQRIKKENFTTGTANLYSTDYYVSDLSGNLMALYTSLASSPSSVVQKEMPIYGISRLGICMKAVSPNPEVRNYEITDHLGNVRAVIQKTGNPYPNNVAMNAFADYYPFGEQLAGRNSANAYRYAFQGQEIDQSTEMEAFKLRLWDGRLGRWMSPDPYGQHFSPYLGMGNNPAVNIDPDGGYETKLGAFLSWVAGGFKGTVISNPNVDNMDPSRNFGIKYKDGFLNKGSGWNADKTVYNLDEVGLPVIKYHDKKSSSGSLARKLLEKYQWFNRHTTLNFKTNIGFDWLRFRGYHYGVPEWETSFLNGQGAVTPGSFVLYPTKGTKPGLTGSEDPYYNTHEPGHALQYRILGPGLYIAAVVIPSVMHSSDKGSEQHYHEKSANTLWYIYTGEHDQSNPRFFFDDNRIIF
ncbi:RHS repeat-associated core domain-containing protein [Flavobacterium pallidum]|uniref:LTD domain-containing protein n=1 Tax=Flavobacterium pallidum TaxID=2172098 RepID=A0A2S1SFX1_9FLAO|nr:RHS repeat-associated core domain-containing protein [Flavobacterium pallidum]AWI25285.1 hypothetical protein HYN49_04885 [Flavobacterium pallidum]